MDSSIWVFEPMIMHLAGSYAELALVKEQWAAPAPKNLSLETEAGEISAA